MIVRLPDPPDPPGLRKFGIVTGIGFGILFGVALPWVLNVATPIWPFVISGLFIVTGLVAPTGLRQVFRVWMCVAQLLGWANSQVLLTLIYIVVLTPIGLLRRLMGADPLGKRFSNAETTYRRPSEVREPNHVERPF